VTLALFSVQPSSPNWYFHTGSSTHYLNESLQYSQIPAFLRRGRGEGNAELLSLVPRDSRRGSGSKLHQGVFRLVIRKHFFTETVFKHRNRLSGEVVDASSLSVFEAFGQCP